MMRIPMVTATPVPSPSSTVDPNLVTPGPWGFLVIALLAVAVILLITDMMRRIRRGRVRADIRDELDAEARADAEGLGVSDESATETDEVDPERNSRPEGS
jgi:hypothetical protein